jgi:hypothetical protein
MAKFVANTPTLRKLDARQRKALQQTAYALKTEVQNAEVTPFDTGATQNTNWVSETSKGFRLNYSTEYAPKIYWNPEGRTFQTAKNANARSEWLEPWIRGSRKDWCKKTFRRFMAK